MLLPDGKAEYVQKFPWLVPHFATPAGRMLISFQCFVLRSRDKCVMIDTCIGNDRQREFPVFCNMQTTFLEDLAAAGFPPGKHRHRDVLAPALRPRRLEHAQGRRQVGADLPAGALSLRQEGIRTLAAPARHRRLPQLRSPGRFDRPDRRGQSARVHRDRPRHHRRSVAGADAGPHARPRQRAHSLAGRGGGHHRRHDASPDPARRPGDARQLRHGQGAGRQDAPRLRRALRRQEGA